MPKSKLKELKLVPVPVAVERWPPFIVGESPDSRRKKEEEREFFGEDARNMSCRLL